MEHLLIALSLIAAGKPAMPELPGMYVAEQRARLSRTPPCLLADAATRLGVALKPGLPLPGLRYESQTTLAEFQKDAEAQFGPGVPAITNIYVVAKDRIYLIDDPAYYRKLGRLIDDSLVHEYVHYLQVRYRGYTVRDLEDPAAEAQAIEVQSSFREDFKAGRLQACP